MSENLNAEIDGTTWNQYEKNHVTWAVKVPVDVVVPTREGEVKAEGGDYLCIDDKGGLYPCEADTFETMYDPVEPLDDVHEVIDQAAETAQEREDA